MKAHELAGKSAVIIMLGGIGVLITACHPYTERTEGRYVLPDELKDCKFFKLSDGISHLTVVRCPNSSTSTLQRQGKTTKQVLVVEGATFEER